MSHKLITTVSICCLLCLAMIMLARAGSPTVYRIKQIIPPQKKSSLTQIDTGHAHLLSVFEAVVGSSYEVFLSDGQTGYTRQLTHHTGNDRFPVLSPDGTKVAFVSWRDGSSDIYMIDIITDELRNLSNNPTQDALPVWSPDSTMLAYASRRNGDFDIYIVDVVRLLTHNLTRSPHHDSQPEWLPDGRLIFTSNREGMSAEYVVDLGQQQPVLYRGESAWQTAQNAGMLNTIQETRPE